jgi:hypothetical protein
MMIGIIVAPRWSFSTAAYRMLMGCPDILAMHAHLCTLPPFPSMHVMIHTDGLILVDIVVLQSKEQIWQTILHSTAPPDSDSVYQLVLYDLGFVPTCYWNIN